MSLLEHISQWNDALNNIVWGPYMLIFMVICGIYISAGCGFFQFTRLKLWMKGTFGILFKREKNKDKNKITPFQAVSTALAGTVGIGNIVGTSTAIVSGGPGAIFWMWISSLFGMMTKYAEVVLAVKFRNKDKNGTYYGGPMYYLEKGLNSKFLAVLFSLFGALACFGIGNMTQVNAISQGMNDTFGISPLITGLIVAVIVGFVIIGGISRIAKVTSTVVPFMAVFYILGGLIVLIINSAQIPQAFSEIFQSAFSFKALGSGVMGYGISQAIRYGFARGVFSNEAGLGSAPIAHAAASTDNPVKQGLWGIFEVFVDTIVMCTLTSLIVLTSGLHHDPSISAGSLTTMAFAQTFGNFGSIFIAIATVFFALSTMLGWSYYGEQCVKYLAGKRSALINTLYKVAYIVIIVVGATSEIKIVWEISDTLNGLMAIPNLIAIFGLSGIVFKTTKDYLKNPNLTRMHD